MLASLLADEHGVEATVARFGCDTDVYRRTNFGARNGIAFYARLANPWRGFRLGALALAEFHRRHPEIEIHMYGDADARVDADLAEEARQREVAETVNPGPKE